MFYTSQKYSLDEEIKEILKEKPNLEDYISSLFSVFYIYQNPKAKYDFPPMPKIGARDLPLAEAKMLLRKLKEIEGVREVYIDVQ